MKKIFIMADSHLCAREEPHPSYVLAKKIAADIEPDMIIHLGDFLDLPYFASFNKEKIAILADGNWEEDVLLMQRELKELQSYTTSLHIIEGNHDNRTEQVGLKIPAFAKSIDYETRFHFRENGIGYHRMVGKVFKVGKLSFVHGFYYNKYHARKTLDEYVGNIIYGHVHANQTFSRVLPARNFEEIQAWSIGCLCEKDPDYVKGRPTGHQNAVAVAYMREDGNFNMYPINIVRDRCIFEGTEYAL